MRKSVKCFLELALVCLFIFFLSQDENLFALENAADSKISLAVIEFQVKGDLGIQDAGAIIAEWMISALAKTEKFDLRERVLLAKVLEEQMFQASGLVDENTIAAKAGELYGVEAIVTGSVLKWGNIISVTARLIDTSTGTILKAADVKAKDVSQIPVQINSLALVLAGGHEELFILNPEPSLLENQILGTWKWFSGRKVRFESDGTVRTLGGRIRATWRLDGDIITVYWRGITWTDKLRLYENGRKLEGTNQLGIRIHGVKISP